MTAVTRIMFFIAYFRRATARVPNTRKTEAKLQPKKGTGPEGPVRIFPGYATITTHRESWAGSGVGSGYNWPGDKDDVGPKRSVSTVIA